MDSGASLGLGFAVGACAEIDDAESAKNTVARIAALPNRDAIRLGWRLMRDGVAVI